MSLWRQIVTILRKDLLLDWRNQARALSVFLFGVVALSLFAFAVGPESATLHRTASGYLVLTLLLSSTLALSESFRLEHSEGALEGLLLLPVEPAAVFLGKALGNTIFLSLRGPILAPVAVVLYAVEVDVGGLARLLGLWILASAALAAPGTLYAAMTSQVRGQDVLLPIIHYPLVIPVLIGAVKGIDLAINGDPMGQMGSWTLLLGCFCAIYWSLGAVLFGYAIEE